jgi:hypothetical protein
MRFCGIVPVAVASAAPIFCVYSFEVLQNKRWELIATTEQVNDANMVGGQDLMGSGQRSALLSPLPIRSVINVNGITRFL